MYKLQLYCYYGDFKIYIIIAAVIVDRNLKSRWFTVYFSLLRVFVFVRVFVVFNICGAAECVNC